MSGDLDGLRDQLAEAMFADNFGYMPTEANSLWQHSRAEFEERADALLPVVAAWGRQQAAQALRDAADWLETAAPDTNSGGTSWEDDATDPDTALAWVLTSLRDRADALSAAVPSQGVQGHPTHSHRPAQGDSAAPRGIEDER